MKKVILWTTLFLSNGVLAQQEGDKPTNEQRDPKYYEILETPDIEVFETEASLEEVLGFSDRCVQRTQNGPFASVADISKIINIGRQIWQIIEAGKPKVSIETEAAYALPEGVNCWSDLEYWQLPTTKNYSVKYRNALGLTVAEFRYKIIYFYGGQLEGHGQYLAGIRVVPKKVEVLWGFELDVEARVPHVMNLGSQQDPIAGAEINVNWVVRSPLKTVENQEVYFASGNGDFRELN